MSSDPAAGQSGPAPERRRSSDPGAGYVRRETQAQRLDRNFAEMLQEVRVAQAGVQILFGFLLSLAFQARFSSLDTFQLDVYLVTLIAAALAVTFLTGPVAAHRLLFRRGLKDFLVHYTARLTTIGIGFLAVSVVGGVLLVVDVLLSRPVAISIGSALVAIGIVVWLVIPATMLRRRRDPQLFEELDQS
ncbi:DUF6328 family protein [Nakamurella sp. A5-74]|uniref:DUF6328 family protein n=1 Tax=Nakamurella sp. A5-74 TaxID=3158264 RepID=A0AAU8DUJ0_9ACTN